MLEKLMKYQLFAIIFLLLAYSAAGKIVINELMAVPSSGEPEWVELYNISDESIKFDSLFICDAAGCKKIPAFELSANSFLVLCSDTAFIIEKYGNFGAMFIQMSLPIFNNTTDEVVLRSNDQVEDSVFYNAKWGTSGKSLERIYPEKPAVSQVNWLASTNPAGATPGKANSVFKEKCFPEISNISRSKTHLVFNYSNNCDISNRFEAVFYKYHPNSTNNDRIIILEDYFDLKANEKYRDSLDIYSIFGADAKGRYVFEIELYQDDELIDSKLFGLQLGISRLDVAINEIMPDPLSGCAEYIELVSNFGDTLSLKDWRMYDESGSFEKKALVFPELNIAPGGYAVLAADSSIFDCFPELIYSENIKIVKSSLTLNNSSDMLVLVDEFGYVIDSLYYYSSWHDKTLYSGKGISLEKVESRSETNNPKNWASSGEGGTPGYRNSASVNSERNGSLEVSPNPFHTKLSISDCSISYTLPFRSARVRVLVFSENGMQIAEPANNLYSNAQGTVLWNGKDMSGNDLPDGLYIVFLEAVSTDNDAVFSKKAVLVLKN